jgi:transglutaminase/protease-like cytokinesis protein 3
MRLILSLLILLLLPLNSFASSNLAVTTWQEKSFINNAGKTSEILVKAKVQNLPDGYNMTSFTFGFGTNNSISIKNVAFDSKQVKSDFVNNNLIITFPESKKNGDQFSLYISYSENYKKINPYLREEAILIPPFAAGANARVAIEFPNDMESATLNLNITQSGNSFVYQNNRVPASGVTEIIKLTPAQSVWNVTSRVKLKSNQELRGVTVEIPDYFMHQRQKTENRTLLASTLPASNTKEGDKYILKYDSDQKQVLIEHRALITTGKNIRKQPDYKITDHIKYDLNDRELLTNILNQIKQTSKYRGLPLYAKIGNFVHDYIKYDRNYIGKTPSVKEILENPVGVCTEYANLFNSLAKIAGIPSMIINGVACGEAGKCEGHAWNIINYNNQWIEVDPTWDLMSGVVSSSHVYFSDDGKQDVGTTYPGDGRIIEVEVESDIKPAN